MSENSTAAVGASAPAGSAIPADAGLAAGRQTPQDGARRSSDDLITAAAVGDGLSPRENDDLVAYFLDHGELPDDSKPKPLAVRLGNGGRKFRCAIRRITWDEYQDGVERGTNQKTGELDTYVLSSYNVARALITPKLGPTVIRLQKEASDSDDGKIAGPGGSRIDPPADSAVLLQRMFRKQSGALLELGASVLEYSKLARDNNSIEDLTDEAVREVDAAKN